MSAAEFIARFRETERALKGDTMIVSLFDHAVARLKPRR